MIWDGTGANPGNALTYREAADSLWLFSWGRLLWLALDPDRWVERACEIAARDLTQEEWDRYVPGAEPLQSSRWLTPAGTSERLLVARGAAIEKRRPIRPIP